eukprot:4918882-Amphidinium_carterae.1
MLLELCSGKLRVFIALGACLGVLIFLLICGSISLGARTFAGSPRNASSSEEVKVKEDPVQQVLFPQRSLEGDSDNHY